MLTLKMDHTTIPFHKVSVFDKNAVIKRMECTENYKGKECFQFCMEKFDFDLKNNAESIAPCTTTLPAPDHKVSAVQALCEAQHPHRTFKSIADSGACVQRSTPGPLKFIIPEEIRCREMRERVYDSKNTFNHDK